MFGFSSLAWPNCFAGSLAHTVVGATRSPAWHRNNPAARRRARRASRRGVATERQKKRLSSHMTCPNCGVSCSAGRRKCTTPKPKTLQDGESAGVGTCGLARDQNVRTRATLRAEKLATGVQLRGGWSARLLRGRGSKLVVMATGRRLFAEVLKTEAQRVSLAFTSRSGKNYHSNSLPTQKTCRCSNCRVISCVCFFIGGTTPRRPARTLLHSHGEGSHRFGNGNFTWAST